MQATVSQLQMIVIIGNIVPGSARHAPGRSFEKETWLIVILGIHGELEKSELK